MPKPCGCRIEPGKAVYEPYTSTVERDTIKIAYCPLHVAAPQMREALQKIYNSIPQYKHPKISQTAHEMLYLISKISSQALTAAKGETFKTSVERAIPPHISDEYEHDTPPTGEDGTR